MFEVILGPLRLTVSRRAVVDDDPMLADTGLRWQDQDGTERMVTANDQFLAVHDAFGHGLEGAGFRARGEENAWQAHVRLFTGPAVGTITSETRGQNSRLNYGPHGEKNRNAKVEDTTFADQKTGLMPEWTWTEGRAAYAEYYSDRTNEESNDGVTEQENGAGGSRGYGRRAAVGKRSGKQSIAAVRSRVGSDGTAWRRSQDSRTVGVYGVVASYKADAPEWVEGGVAAPSFFELQKSAKSATIETSRRRNALWFAFPGRCQYRRR